jgi:NADH-quinone oxidoreductase subunit K
MIHPVFPLSLVAILFGTGLYGVIARRNAILMLIGVELMLAAAGLLFVTVGAISPDVFRAGQAVTIFVITIAAAETAVALAVILAVFRARSDVDLSRAGESDR